MMFQRLMTSFLATWLPAMAILAMMAGLPGQDAEAKCYPSLYNCYCTYRFPCPVEDHALRSMTGDLNGKFQGLNQLLGPEGYTGPATPIDGAALDNANIATASALLRNALRNPGGTSLQASAPKPLVAIPEKAIKQDWTSGPTAQIPAGSGTGGATSVEDFESATQRVHQDQWRDAIPERTEDIALTKRLQGNLTEHATYAYGRALLSREKLQEKVAHGIALERKLETPMTQGEEMRLNSDIHLGLQSLQAEVLDLMQARMALRGTKQRASSDGHVAAPILPMDAQGGSP